MAGRMRVWVGGGVAAAAVVGLGVYFAAVGLEDPAKLDTADKLASVIGLVVAVAGLVVAVVGLVADRRAAGNGSGGGGSGPGTASGERSVAVGGDNTGIVSTGDNTTNTQQR